MTRETAIEWLDDIKNITENWSQEVAIDMAIEALSEPKTGKWAIEKRDCIYGQKYILTCSECGDAVSVTESSLPHEKYCRNCGSKMKGADNE